VAHQNHRCGAEVLEELFEVVDVGAEGVRVVM
jgi:hypothetical protein